MGWLSENRKLTVITATPKPDRATGANPARALALWPSVPFHLAKEIDYRCPAVGVLAHKCVVSDTQTLDITHLSVLLLDSELVGIGAVILSLIANLKAVSLYCR